MAAIKMTPLCTTSMLLPLFVLFLDYLAADVTASTSWDHLSLRYGFWYKPPRTPREAVAMGYKRINGICQMDTYHGFLYVHPHGDASRLIFDLNDKLAGIQAAIPGNLNGFNSNNESIRVPTKEVIPPILLSQEHYSPGVQMYTITAYFKHPSLICSPYTKHAHPGKGLYIQMGYRVDREFEKIPLEAHHLSEEWKAGICFPYMGRHYFKNLTKDMPCEKLYPVFLLYNVEGQLGGFGWLFQGTPQPETSRSLVKWFKHSVQFYPAIFDDSMLPPCMSNPEFRVFGIRNYLRNEHTMTCPRPPMPDDGDYSENEDGKNEENEEVTFRPLSPKKSVPNTTASPRAPKYTNSRNNNNIIVDDVMRQRDGNNSASKTALSCSLLCVFICFISAFFKCVHIFNISVSQMQHLSVR